MKSCVVVAFLLSVPFVARGSEPIKPWSVGASVTYPMAPIYEVQLARRVGVSGEALTGFAYQNWENDEGRSHAFTLLAGYRQYVWRGLHGEVELWPAYNPFRSKIDGKLYSGFELWTSVRVGYRASTSWGDRELFLLLQPSLGFGCARQNRWPGMNGPPATPIFEPQAILGLSW